MKSLCRFLPLLAAAGLPTPNPKPPHTPESCTTKLTDYCIGPGGADRVRRPYCGQGRGNGTGGPPRGGRGVSGTRSAVQTHPFAGRGRLTDGRSISGLEGGSVMKRQVGPNIVPLSRVCHNLPPKKQIYPHNKMKNQKNRTKFIQNKNKLLYQETKKQITNPTKTTAQNKTKSILQSKTINHKLTYSYYKKYPPQLPLILRNNTKKYNLNQNTQIKNTYIHKAKPTHIKNNLKNMEIHYTNKIHKINTTKNATHPNQYPTHKIHNHNNTHTKQQPTNYNTRTPPLKHPKHQYTNTHPTTSHKNPTKYKIKIKTNKTK